VASGVEAHAQVFLEAVRRELGPKMPPVRSLLSAYSGSAGSTSTAGEETFMSCVSKAVPDPTKVCKCIADNLDDVFRMVKTYMDRLTQ